MKKSKMLIAMVVTILLAGISAETKAVTYDFDDGTLQGWTNDAAASEDFVAHDTVSNDNGGRTKAHSPDYALLEADFSNRDSGDTNVKIFTSPKFMVDSATSIEIWTLGGVGGTATPTWTNIANLPAVATVGDFMGAALRRVSDGEYLLFSRRSGSGQSGRTINWLTIGWDAATISAAVAGDAVDETYVVDVIDAYSGGWGWIGVDDATLDAFVVGDNPIAILPSPADGEVDVAIITTTLDWELLNEPNADTTFNVYLGTDSTGETWLESATGLTDSQYSLQTITLEKDLTYFWYVQVVEDLANPITHEPNSLWAFDTELSLPQIESNPSDVMGGLGETVQFSIVAVDPLDIGLSYQWYKGQSPDISNPVGTDSSELFVGPLAAEDFLTTYYCVVTNSKASIDSQSATIFEKKLLAHWTLDDSVDPNSIVVGSPATSINGDPIGVDGIIGQAMEFDGDDDYLYVPETADYFDEMYKECTVACWVKSDGTPDWSAYVAKYGESGQGWQLRDYRYSEGEPAFGTRGTGNDDLAPGGTTVTDGQWHFVVGTYNGQIKNVYVDGVLGSSVDVSGTINTTEGPISIGARISPEGVQGAPFTGAIDDVRLFNYALDKVTVAQMYADATGENVCPELPIADLNADCVVNLEDFAIVAENWMIDNTVLPQ